MPHPDAAQIRGGRVFDPGAGDVEKAQPHQNGQCCHMLAAARRDLKAADQDVYDRYKGRLATRPKRGARAGRAR